MGHFISPNYNNDKLKNLTTDNCIDVFEDRINFWLIEPAQMLIYSYKYGIVPGVSLLMSYFEGIMTYIEGEESTSKSKRFFKKGFVVVFISSGETNDTLNKFADFLYKQARCGFFHDGTFRNKIFFGEEHEAALTGTFPKKNGIVDKNGNIVSIIINPKYFFKAIEKHFKEYVAKLRKDSQKDLINKFEKIFHKRLGVGEPPVIIGTD